ncbi:unnamed protein product [Acanthosepion pharaonis]|uniref:Interferon-related developmental regulator N-terminal domain-containing protein n=1 Tax=Acanthosepion pharaonis TaxID=158019 RepID=A0A812DCF6_ACAPH|nr:unnamed protein product [Sepia pharaonis]
MPKGKRKGIRRGTSSRPSSDDEMDTPDNQSVISSISDDGYFQPIAEEGTNYDGDSGEVDESANQQNFEDGIRECIDGLCEKSQQTRINSLTLLSKTLSMKYIYDFLMNIKFTVVEYLTRCLKKGKGDEQALAAQCISHLCIQLGEDSENIFEDLRETFLYMLNDQSTPVKTRQKNFLKPCLREACTFILMEIKRND